jgi:hypothetical protein
MMHSSLVSLPLVGAMLLSAVAECAGEPTREAADSFVRDGGVLTDTIWLVSSRHLPSQVGCAMDSEPLRFWRMECSGRTWRADREAFLADGSGHWTCIYAHGNRISPGYAIRRGLEVYRTLRANQHNIPLRFVVWSWPSDTIHGPVRDARIKAARTDAEGFYMAALLHDLSPDEPLSLIGFSFGSRIITGALHLLAGGSLRGQSLPLDSGHVMPATRVVLMASAMDNDWLLPGHPHGLAVSKVDRLLLLNNSRDHALKRYWVVSGSHQVPALGFAGSCRVGR